MVKVPVALEVTKTPDEIKNQINKLTVENSLSRQEIVTLRQDLMKSIAAENYYREANMVNADKLLMQRKILEEERAAEKAKKDAEKAKKDAKKLKNKSKKKKGKKGNKANNQNVYNGYGYYDYGVSPYDNMSGYYGSSAYGNPYGVNPYSSMGGYGYSSYGNMNSNSYGYANPGITGSFDINVNPMGGYGSMNGYGSMRGYDTMNTAYGSMNGNGQMGGYDPMNTSYGSMNAYGKIGDYGSMNGNGSIGLNYGVGYNNYNSQQQMINDTQEVNRRLLAVEQRLNLVVPLNRMDNYTWRLQQAELAANALGTTVAAIQASATTQTLPVNTTAVVNPPTISYQANNNVQVNKPISIGTGATGNVSATGSITTNPALVNNVNSSMMQAQTYQVNGGANNGVFGTAVNPVTQQTTATMLPLSTTAVVNTTINTSMMSSVFPKDFMARLGLVEYKVGSSVATAQSAVSSNVAQK